MAYTLGDAAKATGKSKTTIKRALDKGRISGEKNAIGEWQIEPVELHRVYPMVDPVPVTGDTPQSAPLLQAEIRELTVKLEAAREAISRERDLIRDLQQDRDHWRQQATALLTDQRPVKAGFWSRLFKGR